MGIWGVQVPCKVSRHDCCAKTPDNWDGGGRLLGTRRTSEGLGLACSWLEGCRLVLWVWSQVLGLDLSVAYGGWG